MLIHGSLVDPKPKSLIGLIRCCETKLRPAPSQNTAKDPAKASHDRRTTILSQFSYHLPRPTMDHTFESKEAVNKSSSVTSDGDKADYAHGTRLFALTASLMLGIFLTALDNVRISGHSWTSFKTEDPSARPSSALRSPELVTSSTT